MMGYGETTSLEIERVAKQVIDAAYRVHSRLGPGLLESVYETCLVYELKKRGMMASPQVPVPILYDGEALDANLRLDLLVENCVLVEIKAVEKHNALFEAQVLTYLKLTGIQLGLLINFNVQMFKDGVRRIICSFGNDANN